MEFLNENDNNENEEYSIDETNHVQEQMKAFRVRREAILNRIINERPEENGEITLIASETIIFRDEIKLEKCKDFFIFSLARLRQIGFIKESTEITLFFAMLIGLLKIASTGIDVSTDIFNLIVGILPFIQSNARFIIFVTSGIITLFSFFGYSIVNLKETLYSVFRGDPRDDDAIKESIKAILGKNFLLTMTENVDISQMLIKYQAYIITCLEYLQSIGCPNFDFKTIFIDFITKSVKNSEYVLQDVCTNIIETGKNIIETGKNMIKNNANYLAAFDNDNDSVVSDYKTILSESLKSSESSQSSKKLKISASSQTSQSSQNSQKSASDKTIDNVEKLLTNSNQSEMIDEEKVEMTDDQKVEKLIAVNDNLIVVNSNKEHSQMSDITVDNDEELGGSKRKSKTSKKSSKRTKHAKKTTKRTKKSTKRAKKSNKRTKKH
jgi:hypothetical protein